MLSKVFSSALQDPNRLIIEVVRIKPLTDDTESIHFIAKDNFGHYVSAPFSAIVFLERFKSERVLLNYVLSLPQFVDLSTINNYDNHDSGEVVLKSNIEYQILGYNELRKEKK